MNNMQKSIIRFIFSENSLKAIKFETLRNFKVFSTLRKDMYKILIYIPLFCITFQEQQPFCWCSSVINLIGETFSHIVGIASLLAIHK